MSTHKTGNPLIRENLWARIPSLLYTPISINQADSSHLFHSLSPFHLRLFHSEKIEDCVAGADLILHLTEWKEYRELDPAAIKKLVKQAKILDGRNMLDRDKWRAAGWDFHALGRA